MKAPGSSGKLGTASLLMALGSSLCCITPILVLISGASGLASSLTWINPYRPVLMGISIVVLLFAWYQVLKPAKPDCDCATDKTPFFKGKKFLAVVTVISVLLMTFPLYSSVFSKNANSSAVVAVSGTFREVKLQITGMDCQACEYHVNKELAKLNGVLQYQTSSASGTSIIKFDTNKIAIDRIVAAVNQTGYKVIHQSFKN